MPESMTKEYLDLMRRIVEATRKCVDANRVSVSIDEDQALRDCEALLGKVDQYMHIAKTQEKTK